MASHVEHVKQLLEKIKYSSQFERKALLKALSNKEVKLLCEVCLVHCQLKVHNPTTFIKLTKHRKLLSDLAEEQKPIKRKQQLINQKFGFIGALAAATLPIIVDQVYRLVKRR